jgi:pyridoxal phosphate enzyme (YggS family)
MSLDEKAWQDIRSRILNAASAAGRDPASIRLLAVSKSFPAESIRAAYDHGQRAFGENYVREAEGKMAALSGLPGIEWHLIGPLQSNKTKAAGRSFGWVETIDRKAIAQRLASGRDAVPVPLNVCIQVNISGEPAKHGVSPAEALGLARDVAILPGIALRGFMGIAATDGDAALARAQFRLLREIYDDARRDGHALDTLSMGMSSDLEIAVAEGATELRIGSALFGPRTIAAH